MLKLKNNKKPNLNIPSFSVDNKLKDKLDNIEIFKLMNKSHFALFLGKVVYVQKNLKGDCEKFLLHIINNRRHNRICIWICCQNYKTIPLQVRLTLTDLFIFKVGKQEIENIYEELTEIDKNKFNIITNNAYKNLGDFIYLNCLSQRLFNNWDEIII